MKCVDLSIVDCHRLNSGDRFCGASGKQLILYCTCRWMSALRSLFNKVKRLPCRSQVPFVGNCPSEEVPYCFDLSAVDRFPNVAGHLNDPSSLKCLSFPQAASGLLVFPKILTEEASKKWFQYFMEEAPSNSARVLKSNVPLPPEDPHQIRWLTFGYHYDWDEKCYFEEQKDSIPDPIVELLQCLAHLLNLTDWQVETGIVNYYTCKSRLGPHVDGFEKNLQAPLLSLSIGSDAIFVTENEDATKEPASILLKDGDLMVMSGKSRLLSHCLAKVYCSADSEKCSRRKVVRINLNARQFNKEALSIRRRG